MQTNHHRLFPTLVVEVEGFITPEQCADLAKYGESLSDKTAPHAAIVGDGISSFVNQSMFLAQAVAELGSCKELDIKLIEEIHKYLKATGFKGDKVISNSWFNVQNTGSTLQKHTHPGAIISGALYVNVDENSSPICFYNPNPYLSFSEILPTECTDFTYEWFSFKPKLGSLLLFPSWLAHGSNGVQNNTQKRMVISFNVI
jgi:uncharacterized protein (TIGR02466 family)